MTDHERIKMMHKQIAVLKRNEVPYNPKWKKYAIARRTLKDAIKLLETSNNDNDKAMVEAMKLAAETLTQVQGMVDNLPLKRIALKNMHGQPVWVVPEDGKPMWGIVDKHCECVVFPQSEEVRARLWDGSYHFKYKKEIIDYSDLLKQHKLSVNF